MRKGEDFIFGVGYFSEIIVALIVIYVLQKNVINTLVYIAFFLFSGYVNTLLKGEIKQPRPDHPKKFLYSEHFSRAHAVYGMPSGHSQNVFFSLTYLYLTARDGIYWMQIGLVLAALMVYERWTFHNHTLMQLFAGALVGIALGFTVTTVRNQLVQSSPILGAK
jgi:membrane-associated phospholipid phosphatase